MKEMPILFSTEMVKAILQDKKTMTRRVINPQPTQDEYSFQYKNHVYPCTEEQFRGGVREQSPFGKIGDMLWVRESWKIRGWNEDGFRIQYRDGERIWYAEPCEDEKAENYSIQCNNECISAGLKPGDDNCFMIKGEPPTKWKPSIFMPRWASRILLEIKNIRVERLQEINEEDAKKEGMQTELDHSPTSAWLRFIEIWNRLNEKRGFGWSKNPWVWVIEFEKIKNIGGNI